MFGRKSQKPDPGIRAPFISFIKRFAVYGFLTTTGLLIFSRFYKSDLQFTFEPTDTNVKIIQGCRQLRRGVYHPTFFLPFGFSQYLYGRIFERNVYVKTKEENIKESLVVRWMPIHSEYQDVTGIISQDKKMSVVLVVTGSRGMDPMVNKGLLAAYRKGFRVVAYQPKQFASTKQLEDIATFLKNKYPQAKLYGLGMEYGANLLVMHAAQTGKRLYSGVVSIGNPLDLEISEHNIKGLWSFTLEKQLIKNRTKKAKLTEKAKTLYDVDRIQHNLTQQQVVQFKKSHSSINYIKDLQINSLFLSSRTDPFSLPKLNEDDRIENSNCLFVQSRSGGHEQWFQSFKTSRWIFKPATQFFVHLDRTL